MRVAIITTTVGTPAVLERFAASARSGGLDWRLYVVGDRKTPDLGTFLRALGPEAVWIPHTEHGRWATSSPLGWDCVQRRNIGFLTAAADGPWDFYLSLDDDNEPQDGFFETFVRIATVPVRRRVRAEGRWFNYFQDAEVSPAVTPYPRGFPIRERSNARWHADAADIASSDVWVFQGLSCGDPDVDAFVHIAAHPRVHRFTELSVAARGAWSPINSQNTFVRSHCLPLFLMYDRIGRFDDIVAGLILQHYVYSNGAYVHFGAPITRQDRGERDWLCDFEREVEGTLTIDAILNHIDSVDVTGVSPTEALRRTFAHRDGMPSFFERHRPLVDAWLSDLAGAVL